MIGIIIWVKSAFIFGAIFRPRFRVAIFQWRNTALYSSAIWLAIWAAFDVGLYWLENPHLNTLQLLLYGIDIQTPGLVLLVGKEVILVSKLNLASIANTSERIVMILTEIAHPVSLSKRLLLIWRPILLLCLQLYITAYVFILDSFQKHFINFRFWN